MNEKELIEVYNETIRIAHLAGEHIFKYKNAIENLKIVEKDLNSLVSKVDTETEELIVNALREILPESTFLTEEETVVQEKGEYTWIIDPLDGTTNFLFGIPVFAVSIALQHNGETILGVIHEVNHSETFSAHKYSNAKLNGNEIQVSEKSNINACLFATGFPYYDFSKTSAYMNILSHLVKNSRGVRRMGSAAVDMAYVACGRFDGFFEYSLQAWDVAAGAFIVQKAGGSVSDFRGKDDYLYGKEIIAAGSNIYPDFFKLINTEIA
ncbi:MAG: inositol monophosphatase [Chitinophagaceae bacterium]|nr:MAG: inositol monophosphatase [Chitinophagaceae bacterium]